MHLPLTGASRRGLQESGSPRSLHRLPTTPSAATTPSATTAGLASSAWALWLLCWLSLGACEQPPPPTLDSLYDDGYTAMHRGELQLAERLAHEGRARSETNRNTSWQEAFLVLEAEVLAGRRQDKAALQLLEPLLEASSATGAGPQRAVEIRALMTRGLLRCRAGGAQAFQDGWASLEAAGRGAFSLASSSLQGEVDLRLGTCHFVHGRAKDAEPFFERALTIARREKILHLQSHASGSLGLVRIETGRFDEATEWLEQALSTAEDIDAHISAAKTVSNLGWCYLQLGNYERALSLLTQAEVSTRELGLSGDRLMTLNNMGRACFKLGRFAEAHDHYAQALALTESLGARPTRARVLSNMALIASKERRFEDAEELLGETLALKVELGDRAGEQHALLAQSQIFAARGQLDEAEAMRRQVIASPHSRPSLLWEAHGALAQLYADTDRRELAETELATAIQLMDASGAHLKRVGHRLSFFSGLEDFYDVAVALKIDTDRPKEALQIVTSSRARLIRELLSSDRDRAATPSVDDLVALARTTNTILLSYWTMPQRSFVWLVHAQGVEIRALPPEAELRRNIETYQASILRSGDPLIEAAPEGERLWRALVEPVKDWIPTGSRVIIAADGPLHGLSFETLIVPGDSNRPPHYWIEDVIPALTPSLSLLSTGPSADKPTTDSILLIGDPLPADADFPRLPHAGREIQRIADLFEPSARTIFSGSEADPTALVRARPERFALIHLAAHVTANREIPLDSAIVLSPGAGAHKLYARDVIHIPLNAELVTLSACRSAGSRTYAGEGLVGLAWAFMSAGAHNVVGGLWDVEDASTSELMELLYRGLKEGQMPAEALREAKLHLLRSDTAYRKPFYWAPFVIFHGPAGLVG